MFDKFRKKNHENYKDYDNTENNADDRGGKRIKRIVIVLAAIVALLIMTSGGDTDGAGIAERDAEMNARIADLEKDLADRDTQIDDLNDKIANLEGQNGVVEEEGADTEDAILTDEDLAYIAQMQESATTFSRLFQNQAELFMADDMFSDRWITKMAFNLVEIEAAIEDARGIDVPDKFEEVSENYNLALDEYMAGIKILPEAVDNFDDAALNQYAEHIETANAYINAATEKMKEIVGQ